MSVDYFAGRLRELREGKGLSRQELADAAGLKVGGVRDLEQGRRKPAWETVLALCKALGVSCEAFTQEPGEREPTPRGRQRKTEEEQPPPKPRKKGTGG